MEYRRSHHCLSIPFYLHPNRQVVVVSGFIFPLKEYLDQMNGNELID